MLRFRFRVRPTGSFLDMDLPALRAGLARVEGLERVEWFDERKSDATFVSLHVTLAEPNPALLERLRQGLLQLPAVTVYVLGDKGTETPVALVADDRLADYGWAIAP